MADGIRFSLDIGYELSGPDTTNWKQTTRESADGCLFDFEVFVREKAKTVKIWRVRPFVKTVKRCCV